MSRPEALLERHVLAAIGRAPDLGLYRNEVGQGFPGIIGPMLRRALAEHPVALAIVSRVLQRNRIAWGLGVGSPDLVGVLQADDGRGLFVGLELKAPDGCLAPEQQIWHEAARRRGACIAVVRSVDDAVQAIEHARRGLGR